MKILYGVQATGNGHITRARCLGPELQRAGAQVDYLFSGRAPEKLFDMESFGEFSVRKGLTFAIRNGRMQPATTVRQADLKSLRHDIHALETHRYDLVITDFEPITAWAARRNGTPSIGIGHQYAFRHAIPKQRESVVSRTIMRWFAPAQIEIGLHWHHFGHPILPPMIEATTAPETDNNQVLVYLPFDDATEVLHTLRQIEGYQFHFFTGDLPPGPYGRVRVNSPGRASFQSCLTGCASVISGAGFELTSEALNLGRRILVKPTQGQMEQESNALALTTLGLGQSITRLNAGAITSWLTDGRSIRVHYPPVARELSQWIVSGDREPTGNLVRRLWHRTEQAAL